MVSVIQSGTVLGVEGHPVHVEVDLVRRLPRTTIVGLPSGAVRESTERVRSAIVAAGFEYPKLRVTINLAPADLKKEGTALDLPIAVAILCASGQLEPERVASALLAGELSLDGKLRPVRGALSLAMLAAKMGIGQVIVPSACALEADMVPGVETWPADSLAEVVALLRGDQAPRVVRLAEPRLDERELPDMKDVRGQPLARRALEIAAAGGHNLLLLGPPGVGKTMLAARLPSILPGMRFDEALEATRVHSAAGLLPPKTSLLEFRPFRAPHHSISSAGMLGGASLRPGEVSLAHHGVLFLDELPEFPRSVIELLRAPLEAREVVISRAAGTVRLPASFTLVAAANPCPCGYNGHPRRPCRCTESEVRRYQSRLSGPLLDRIDLFVEVDAIGAEELFDGGRPENSEAIRARVDAARRMQTARYEGTALRVNAELDGNQARDAARCTAPAGRMLRDAVERLALSGRAHDRLLKVARTIADLDGVGRVGLAHMAEAVSLRGRLHEEEGA